MRWPRRSTGFWRRCRFVPQHGGGLEFEFAGDFQANQLGNYKGRNFHFGIREHAMCAVVNGMVLTGLRAFGSGFLIFMV